MHVYVAQTDDLTTVTVPECSPRCPRNLSDGCIDVGRGARSGRLSWLRNPLHCFMVRAGFREPGVENGERAKVTSLIIAGRRAAAPSSCMRGRNATSHERLRGGERC